MANDRIVLLCWYTLLKETVVNVDDEDGDSTDDCGGEDDNEGDVDDEDVTLKSNTRWWNMPNVE